MKKETAQDRLNALLGLTTVAEEVKVKSTGNTVGITEDNIQKWREIQGLIYFLQAPTLFTPKVCKNCGCRFVVSRLYVAFCSYDCISESLRDKGIIWTKGDNLEELALDPQVYQGNEPIWVRQPILSRLKEMLEELSNLEIKSSVTSTVSPDNTGKPTSTTIPVMSINSPTVQPEQKITQSPITPTSSVPSPTTPPKVTTKQSSMPNTPKPRRISFG